MFKSLTRYDKIKVKKRFNKKYKKFKATTTFIFWEIEKSEVTF